MKLVQLSFHIKQIYKQQMIRVIYQQKIKVIILYIYNIQKYKIYLKISVSNECMYRSLRKRRKNSS